MQTNKIRPEILLFFLPVRSLSRTGLSCVRSGQFRVVHVQKIAEWRHHRPISRVSASVAMLLEGANKFRSANFKYFRLSIPTKFDENSYSHLLVFKSPVIVPERLRWVGSGKVRTG
jgi:hypothetical protein